MEQFQVDKTELARSRIVSAQTVNELEQGVVFKVERFAFTANNLTYYMVGDTLGYWQFFPTTNTEKNENWGIIPVWGVGKVVHSNNNKVAVGSRYFGYFPTATHLHMQSVSINHNTLIDCSAHRLKLPQGYNIYRPLTSAGEIEDDDALARTHTKENMQMLLWPLYATSFCLWEVVSAIPNAQREQVLVLSASSKTSLGLAFAMKRDDLNVIGVTSKHRVETVRSLDVYSEVISYDDIDKLEQKTTVIVDMSGNAKLKAHLTACLESNVSRYINVGLTHWQETNVNKGNKSTSNDDEFFFAPAHIQSRMKTMGAAEYQKLSSTFVFEAIAWSSKWLKVQKRKGLAALSNDFTAHCQGDISADTGMIYQLDGKY
ncbi:DUF2855 family protein [Alteromonas gracilis]|uniref:DUF2855 family protein n=1 Tax=Alteromonas gracilis TaxID=1479524 RepID=UPI003736952A